jgi:hypothetical protein
VESFDTLWLAGNEMSQEIEKSGGSGVPSTGVLNLGSLSQLDVSRMSPEVIAELQRQHAMGMIDANKKAQELKVDVAALTMLLDSFNTEASKATQSNVSMTATHTQTTSIGRTEVVIGNTDRAASGKLSASAIGGPDRILWIVGIIAGAAILIALLVSHH